MSAMYVTEGWRALTTGQVVLLDFSEFEDMDMSEIFALGEPIEVPAWVHDVTDCEFVGPRVTVHPEPAQQTTFRFSRAELLNALMTESWHR